MARLFHTLSLFSFYALSCPMEPFLSPYQSSCTFRVASIGLGVRSFPSGRGLTEWLYCWGLWRLSHSNHSPCSAAGWVCCKSFDSTEMCGERWRMETGIGFCDLVKQKKLRNRGNLWGTHHTVPMAMGPRNERSYIDFIVYYVFI